MSPPLHKREGKSLEILEIAGKSLALSFFRGKIGSKRPVCRNRAAGRFSAPRGETLLLLPPRPSQTYTRARGHEGPRGICSGCEIHSARGDDTTQTVLNKNIEGAQGFSPWSPSQEGARDQSSSARRGLPSKGEARALHHQPAPALTHQKKTCEMITPHGVITQFPANGRLITPKMS